MKIDAQRLVERGDEVVFHLAQSRETCYWLARQRQRNGDDEGVSLLHCSAERLDELIAYITRRKKPAQKRTRKGGAA